LQVKTASVVVSGGGVSGFGVVVLVLVLVIQDNKQEQAPVTD
jgi:hypothetical protein